MDNWEIYNYVKAKKGGSGGQPVTNPALRLIDWEGTVLKEYSAEQSENLTTLPTPSSLRADVDRDLLTFQGYNWALADIKAWVLAHEGRCLTVGAIYTTTDGQDHTYRNNPRINTSESVSMLKKGTTSIGSGAFNNCYSLTNINLPDGIASIGTNAFNSCRSLISISIPNGVTTIGNSTFYGCFSLTSVTLPDGVTTIGTDAFNSCVSLTDIVIKGTPSLADTNALSNIYEDYLIYVPRSSLPWFEIATNWAVFYAQGKIVTIEDNVEYLESIGIDV